MNNVFIYILLTLATFGCQNSSKQLVDIMIDVDRETFNPVLEPEVTGNITILGIYSDGKPEPLTDAEITLRAKTKVASGNVQVVELKGNEIIPKEGGIAVVEAVVIKDGQTFKAEKDIVVRPFYRNYHQTLVLKIFMAIEGESATYDPHDLFFKQKDPSRVCTFEEALPLIKRVDNLTRGIPKIIYLVGWEKGGVCGLYPSWDEVNPKLKKEDQTALESLRWLIREAKQYNTTVSLHINMTDAFKKSPLWDEYVKKDIICRDEAGNIMSVGEIVKDVPAYHISYTREWAEGLAQKRIDDLIEMIPELKEGGTIHIDVFIAKSGGRPLSPWHAKPENGGIDMYKEVETQRKIFHYWRERGIDVTGEGIFWEHPPGEGFVGLQPYSWWFPDDKKFQMEVPERLSARGATQRGVGGQELGQGDFRFGSSMHGEVIFLKDKENLPGFLREFCTMTLPWYYLSQLERVALIKDTLYYSDGVTARVENGKKIIRKGDFILREDDNLFVPALWKGKEIIVYSQEGYNNREWLMPKDWEDVAEVDIYKKSLKGTELLQKGVTVNSNKLTLTLGKEEGVSIIPAGSSIN